MKVVIKQTKYCHTDEQIFKDYPILEGYRNKMDYYTGYGDGAYPEYYYELDCSRYYVENSIVIDMNKDELFKLLQELTSESELVIGYASKDIHERYNIDFIVEIYDDWRE